MKLVTKYTQLADGAIANYIYEIRKDYGCSTCTKKCCDRFYNLIVGCNKWRSNY